MRQDNQCIHHTRMNPLSDSEWQNRNTELLWADTSHCHSDGRRHSNVQLNTTNPTELLITTYTIYERRAAMPTWYGDHNTFRFTVFMISHSTGDWQSYILPCCRTLLLTQLVNIIILCEVLCISFVLSYTRSYYTSFEFYV